MNGNIGALGLSEWIAAAITNFILHLGDRRDSLEVIRRLRGKHDAVQCQRQRVDESLLARLFCCIDISRSSDKVLGIVELLRREVITLLHNQLVESTKHRVIDADWRSREFQWSKAVNSV